MFERRLPWFGKRAPLKVGPGAEPQTGVAFYVDEAWYLDAYPDVRDAGVSALFHFANFGRYEGRFPALPSWASDFDSDWYASRYADLADSGMTPIGHYLRFGHWEGRARNSQQDGPATQKPTHWTELIMRVNTLREQRKYHEALQLIGQLRSDHRSDVDAVSWAAYEEFRIYTQWLGADNALPLMPGVLTSSINFSAKLWVLNTTLEHLVNSDAPPGMVDTIVSSAAAEAVKWSGAPTIDDDFKMSEHRRLGLLVNHIKQNESPSALQLGGSILWREAAPVGTLAAAPSPIEAPLLFNFVPRQIAQCLADTKSSDGLSFHLVEGASVSRCGSDIIVFDGDGQFLDCPHGWVPAYYAEAVRRRHEAIENVERVHGASLAIFDQFAQRRNYCHWLYDWYGRIVAASLLGIKCDHIVGAFPPQEDFELSALGAIDGALRKFVAIEDGKRYVFDKLLLPSDTEHRWRHPMYDGHREIVAEARRILLPPGPSLSAPTKLYVPRRHNRKVLNEPDLLNLLLAHGFIAIDTDALTLREQISYFQSARAIVAPHGAALTNVLFCEPGAHMLELFPREGGSVSFFAMSNAVGLRYSCYMDRDSEPLLHDTAVFNDVGLNVDLAFVSRWLASLE